GVSRRRVKNLSNPNNKRMKTNTVDHGRAKAADNTETKMRPKWLALLLVLFSVAMGAGGCADPYYGGYYGGGYYGGGPYYGGGVSYAGGRQYYGGGPYYGGRVYEPGY